MAATQTSNVITLTANGDVISSGSQTIIRSIILSQPSPDKYYRLMVSGHVVWRFVGHETLQDDVFHHDLNIHCGAGGATLVTDDTGTDFFIMCYMGYR